jgi:hydrogenase nickel incorporation protein HypA/HybF
MHELAITRSMLGLVLDKAEEAGAKRVERVNLVIGETTGFVGTSVQTYFDILSRDTIAEQAELAFRTVPATGRCRDCGRTFELKRLEWTCPGCQGSNIQLVGGNELFVESIEVE